MTTEEGLNPEANAEPEDNQDTPTAEQQMETLQAQIKEAQEKAEKAERRAQGLEGSLKEKDKLLKSGVSRDDLTGLRDDFNRQFEILSTAVAMGKNYSDAEDVSEESRKSISDMLKKAQTDAEESRKAKEAQSHQSQIKEAEGEYQQQANTILQSVVEAGFQKGDETYDDIYDTLEDGWRSLSQASLRRAQRQVSKLTPKKKEGSEDVEARIRADERKKVLTEQGMLDAETGQPASALGIEADFLKRMADPNHVATKAELEKIDKYFEKKHGG